MQQAMYIVRNIFFLKSGKYSEAKALIDKALYAGLIPDVPSSRILVDFTGDACRLIFEEGFNSVDDFEKSLTIEHQPPEWIKWNKKFNGYVTGSQREILRLIG